MWILFVLVLVNGKVDATWQPFETQAACEAVKTVVIPKIAGVYPAGEATITCVKLPEPGKLS